ncbi:unnamed protein product [Urochloa humidicola]
MHQKHPECLITDGDGAMARAIEIVLPNADHRLCSWHREQNMLKWFRGSKLEDFRKFIYKAMEVGEFERLWTEFRVTYNIKEDNLWVNRMYDLTKKWAETYTRGRHFLGMQSNRRSESLNSRLRNHLDRKISLVDLVQHYEYCISRIRRNEIELDAKATVSVPFTRIFVNLLEKSAAQIFTPNIFKKVSFQITKGFNWSVTEVTLQNASLRYEVALQGNSNRFFDVNCTFRPSLVDATCQCRKLEHEGIPCAHIFYVLKHARIDTIPPCCVHLRWTMNAKSPFPTEMRTNTYVWAEQMDHFHSLRNKGNLALFKVSRSQSEKERVMKILDDILKEDVQDHKTEEQTSFGPLSAHFSAAIVPFGTKVDDPVKIVSKGAPRSNNKRWKASHEYWRCN